MRVTAYLAAEGFVDHLRHELGDVVERHDRLLFAPGPPRPVAWAANIWIDPERLKITSIGDAVRQLRARGRKWARLDYHLHRRGALIEQQLPKVANKPLGFPQPAPEAPLGSWTLLDENTVIASARCTSPFPHGELTLVEDHEGPPSRAYRKLYEALTLLRRFPKAGERCLDLGACPGSWTWALAGLGADVLAIDRSPLAPAVARLPNVTFEAGNAFALAPEQAGRVDWLFCDVAAYPNKLWDYLVPWLALAKPPRFVCTVKCQGEPDWDTLRRFASVPGGRLVHLHHNRHELTFIHPADGALAWIS
jgi:23S rRNA (cytidine2498-2'-O)-methyltransferase